MGKVSKIVMICGLLVVTCLYTVCIIELICNNIFAMLLFGTLAEATFAIIATIGIILYDIEFKAME